MVHIVQKIENLLLYAKKELGLSLEDVAYARNQLLELFQVEPVELEGLEEPLNHILEPLIQYGIENGIADEGSELRFETKILGLVTPSPSSVIYTFNKVKETEGIKAATDYFYNLCIKNNYIRLNDVKRNICWYANGPKGKIAITINLSKPEKDPKQVLAEKQFKGVKYPKCMLCIENIGFCGTLTHPARQTLRFIPLTLNGESWHMQYSPYVYYDEHCIVFNDKHVPMHIDGNSIERLLEFVDIYPYYFLGSNADLPIVGGSILSHDHYQGGAKVLPMFYTGIRKTFGEYNGATISIRDWYNSVVHIESKDRAAAQKMAECFINFWQTYSDKANNIIAESDGERHNTVTPIATKEKDTYCVDLILRNNGVDEAHPYGIFHPTEDMHNIKKEAIGLIEAMGLFILPGRLKKELFAVMEELTKEDFDISVVNQDPILGKHFNLIVQVMADKGTNLSKEDAQKAVLEQVDNVCLQILECTAVFKNTEEGQKGFDKFMNAAIKNLGAKKE